MIDPEQVLATFRDCLAEKLSEDPNECILVEGVQGHKVAFSPIKLDVHHEEICGWLTQLPIGFFPVMEGGGGGWSFLQACDDREGNQWTGLHQRMDQLFCLGQGLGYVRYMLPRELWPALPGGMPYLGIDLNAEELGQTT